MARKVISGGTSGLSYRFKDNMGQDGGVATTPWYALEPNSFDDFGGEVTTVTRNPISRSRQRKKGTVTDFDASGGFNHDVTQHQLTRLLQGFFHADAFEKPTTAPLNTASIPVTSVASGAGNDYLFDNDPALGFVVGHLVLASGFSTPANNGLKRVSAVTATGIETDTAGIVAEAAPPATAKLQVVGFQFAIGDLSLTVGGGLATLDATIADFTTFGLHPGEWIFVGGDAAGNQFTGNVPGYARIAVNSDIALNGDTLLLDKTTWTPAADVAGAKTMRIFFGTFIRNMTEEEIIVADDIKRYFMDIERTLGSDANGIQSQVLLDCFANSYTYTQPLSDKIHCDMSFVALDEEWRDGTDGLMAGARVNGLGEGAYNTSTNLFRARMSLVDEATLNPSALFAYVQNIELTIENNVSAVKAQGDIGGIDTIEGDFMVGGSATVYFSSVAAVEVIRDYSDVTFDTILANRNAAFVWDIPLLGLGNGRLSVEKDEPISVPLDIGSFENEGGYTASYTNLAYVPSAGMPVT